MTKHSPSKYSLLLTGLAASTPSAFGVVTIFDNGGAGWSFTGDFPTILTTAEVIFTNDDFPGVFPAGYYSFGLGAGTNLGVVDVMGDEIYGIGYAGKTGTPDPVKAPKTKVGTELRPVDEQVLYRGLNSLKFGVLNQSTDPEPSFDGLLGLSLLEETGDASNDVDRLFGWMELEATITGTSYEINVSRIGLEDEQNTPILTPEAVPEAGSTALLLMGAAGLGARRRRKIS